MAFFPRNFYNPDASFAPLFRLLDEFDTYTRPSMGSVDYRRSGPPIWQPKFDVRETGDRYELHGELPGMNKEQVQIEFTGPETMIVRGRVERSYTAGTPATGHLEDAPVARTITEEGESSHHAPAEDERDVAKGSTGVVVNPKSEEAAKEPAADAAKYWLSERSIGEFSRTFNFPSGVLQDAVTASFKDGILSIAVPKAKRHGSRRITIN